MMILRRAAALLSAGVLAAGLSMGAAGSAQAASMVITPPAGYHEFFAPYLTTSTYKCLDVPSASLSAGTFLQLFRCHGWDPDGHNQLWKFTARGQLPTGEYVTAVRNLNSLLCLTAGSGQWLYQQICAGPDGGDPDGLWVPEPSPLDPGGFELQSYALPAYCVTVNDFTGDHTRLTLRLCDGNPADTYLQDWELG